MYALAWIGFGARGGVPVALIALLAALGLALLVVTFRGIDRTAARPADRALGRRIVTINVATGVAVIVVLVAAHVAHAEVLLLPGVLAVMAAHFVPLWRVLRRISLLWMAAALAACAGLALTVRDQSIAALLAAIVFGVNSARLWIAGRG